MLYFVIVAILISLSTQVYPISLGANTGKNIPLSILSIIAISALQVLMYFLGIKIGSSFMYLLKSFDAVVIFIGFLLIGVRMLMEVFTIRKGERSFLIANFSHIVLAAIAQSINSFLVGLMFYFVTINLYNTIIILGASSIVFSLLGVISKPTKTSLAFASLLYTIAGLTMLFSAVYFSFFYL